MIKMYFLHKLADLFYQRYTTGTNLTAFYIYIYAAFTSEKLTDEFLGIH